MGNTVINYLDTKYPQIALASAPWQSRRLTSTMQLAQVSTKILCFRIVQWGGCSVLTDDMLSFFDLLHVISTEGRKLYRRICYAQKISPFGRNDNWVMYWDICGVSNYRTSLPITSSTYMSFHLERFLNLITRQNKMDINVKIKSFLIGQNILRLFRYFSQNRKS